jgi:hypothetical protein
MFKLTFLGTTASVPAAERNMGFLSKPAIATYWSIAERGRSASCCAAGARFLSTRALAPNVVRARWDCTVLRGVRTVLYSVTNSVFERRSLATLRRSAAASK